MMWTTLCLLAVFTAVVHWALGLIQRHRSRLPPGPLGLPLVGNIWALLAVKQPPSTRFANTAKFGKRYGGVFYSKVGTLSPSIFITSYKYFREAVVENSWGFAGRPKGMWMQDETTEKYTGIIASGADEQARNMRKFGLVTLRNFGFGKTSMQESILRESNDLHEEFKKLSGKPFNPRSLIAHTASNVISALALGRTYTHGDGSLRRVNEDITEAMKNIGFSLHFLFPFLRFFYADRKKETMIACFQSAKSFFKKIISEHIPSRISGEPRDFIDVWLDKRESKDASAEDFHVKRLENTVIDIFLAAFDTSATTFQWLFAVLLNNPDVQDKIHREIDENVGLNTQITLEHRDVLTYTEAVILETLRLFPLIPFSIPHETTEDTTLGPYRIPKRTRVFLCLYNILRDPELWTDPESFQPERFLHGGQLTIPEHYVVFGAGRRSCLGEQLARKEIFLVFANLLRCFRFLQPAGEPLASLEKLQGAVIYPNPFNIVVEKRRT